MDKEELKKYIESNYNIKVQAVEKVKNSYRIGTENGDYAIKIIKYDFPHFYFILSAMEHLQKKKFSKIPIILNSVNGSRYVKLEKQYAYLTEWIPSRVSNYDNPIELAKVAQKLGELHNCSTNFNINKQMRPRIGWYSWIKVFNTRCDEILDFKNRINQKAYKSNFDYYGELQEPATMFAKTLRGIGKEHDDVIALNILSERALSPNFFNTVLNEYSRDGQMAAFIKEVQYMGLLKRASYANFGYEDVSYLRNSKTYLERLKNITTQMRDYREPFNDGYEGI